MSNAKGMTMANRTVADARRLGMSKLARRRAAVANHEARAFQNALAGVRRAIGELGSLPGLGAALLSLRDQEAWMVAAGRARAEEAGWSCADLEEAGFTDGGSR